MAAADTAAIPLYPEIRDCLAPSTERILQIFADLTRHEFHHDGHHVKTFNAELSPLQHLIGIRVTPYTTGP